VDTLLRHFGSLKELERASFHELRQFLTRREAEAVIAGQEVVRVVLLDVQNCWITSMDVCKGTLDESLAHPREIFRPVIVHGGRRFCPGA
jgi:DNA repair protein RadC